MPNPQVATLQQQLQAAQTALGAAQTQLTTDSATIARLQSDNADLNAKLNDALATIAKLTTPPTPVPEPTLPPPSPLTTLQPGFARNLGPYWNPDPQFNNPNWPDSPPNGTPDARNIVDYSGTFLGLGVFGIFGGGHGPSEETDIRALDLATLTWSSLYPSTNMTEMVPANWDSDKGRWISTNQPTARHTYKNTVARGREVILMNPRGMPDPTTAMQQAGGSEGSEGGWGGRMCAYNIDTKTWWYGKYGSAYATEPRVPWYFTAGACLDPISQKIIVCGPGPFAGAGGLYLYDRDADNIVVGQQNDCPGDGVLAYSVLADKFYYFRPEGVWEIALDRVDFRNSNTTRLTVTGMPPPSDPNLPAIVVTYDSARHVFGAVQNGVFYYFDPATRAWASKAIQVEAGSTGTPHAHFYCLDYDPNSSCYLFLTGPYAGQPATWAYRPSFDSAGSGGTTPAPTPDPAPVVTTTSNPATAMIAFADGTSAQFSIDAAAGLGRFDGEFVHQDAYIARDAKFPAWAVHFRPDADGSRDEAVIEYGRKDVADPDVSQSYTLTLKDRAGDTILTQQVPRHYRLCRWRWQSSPRPIVRTAADVYAKGWLPKFGTSGMFGGGAATTDYSWNGPFTALPTSAHDPNWADGGDHDQLGLITEAVASYLIFGNDNSLRVARADAEALGNAPFHYRNDDGTLPDYRSLTSTGVGFPALDPASNPGFEVAQGAHSYASHVLAMLTEDPFIIEALHMWCNRRLLENANNRTSLNLPGFIYPGEQRAFAWGVRDILHAWAMTPATVPSWLQPKSYWKACLDDNRTFALTFVNSPARIHSMFRMWTRPGFCSAWESAWLSTVCGMAVVAGLTEWKQVFDWSIGLQMNLATHPQWKRWLGGPYRCTPIKDDAKYDLWKWDAYTDTSIDAGTCTDWDDFFAFYCAGQNPKTRPAIVGSGYGTADDTGHLLFPATWPADDSLMLPRYDTSAAAFGDGQSHGTAGYPAYLGHTRAALAIAAKLGTPGAADAYAGAQQKIAAAYAAWPDGSHPIGQARFSLEAA